MSNEAAWFRHMGADDVVAPVSQERLSAAVRQLGWDVTFPDEGEYPITASLSGREIVIWSVNNGEFLELDHYGTARFPEHVVGEFAGQMNDFNGDPESPHVVRLLPAIANDARVYVRTASLVFIGEGMSDAQLREYLEPTMTACLEMVDVFERHQEKSGDV